jgi:hypothetical protein
MANCIPSGITEITRRHLGRFVQQSWPISPGTLHRSSRRSVSRSVIRAVADGLIFASKTSSSPARQLYTTVSSLMTASHVPIECRLRPSLHRT